MRKLLRSAVLVFSVLLCQAGPASATVHEIVGQWCADRGALEPHGISGGSNAGNFAQPLNAMNFVVIVPNFDPDGDGPLEPGLLVTFDFSHPAAKIIPTGQYAQIGPEPTYLALFVPDTSKPFGNCRALR